MHRTKRNTAVRPIPTLLFRALILVAALLLGGAGRARAQGDAQDLLNQLTALMEKVQAADDPCPYMPQFKSLMSQFANQSPDMYQAMKPTLDLMNHDDTCGGSGGATTRQVPIDGGMAAPPVPSPTASASGRPTLDLSGTVSLASQLLGQPGVTSRCFVDKGVSQCEYFKYGTWLGTEVVCPPYGFWGTKQTGDVAVGLPCTPGQPVGGGGTIKGPSGGPGSGAGGGSGGGSGSGSGSGADSGGSGSKPGGVATVAGLDQCVQASYNDNNVLAYTDACNISITAVWFVGSRSGEGDLTSGQRVNTGYTADEIRQGNLKIYSYACPLGYWPMGPDGHFVTAGSTYSCAKR